MYYVKNILTSIGDAGSVRNPFGTALMDSNIKNPFEGVQKKVTSTVLDSVKSSSHSSVKDSFKQFFNCVKELPASLKTQIEGVFSSVETKIKDIGTTFLQTIKTALKEGHKVLIDFGAKCMD